VILYTLKVNLNLETLELFYLYYYEYLGNVIKCRTFLKPIGIGHAQLRFAHGQTVHILSMCRCQILMCIFVFDDAWAPESMCYYYVLVFNAVGTTREGLLLTCLRTQAAHVLGGRLGNNEWLALLCVTFARLRSPHLVCLSRRLENISSLLDIICWLGETRLWNRIPILVATIASCVLSFIRLRLSLRDILNWLLGEWLELLVIPLLGPWS